MLVRFAHVGRVMTCAPVPHNVSNSDCVIDVTILISPLGIVPLNPPKEEPEDSITQFAKSISLAVVL